MAMKKLLAIAAVTAGGVLLMNRMKKRGGDVSTTRASAVVDVPVSVAYNQWTQFEQFPQFMASVEEVKQLSDTRLLWRANVAGKTKEWEAEITEQVPDRRIAWRSTSGVANEGIVTFEEAGEGKTRVTLEMSYLPETFAEEVGDAFGAVKLQAKQNLMKFKSLLEARGSETGAWRGTVPTHH